MTISGSSDDLTRASLDVFGAPVTFTGDLMWLHVLTDENAVARHVHDTVVVVFFREGSGRHEIAGHDRPISPGDVVIVPPGAVHDLTAATAVRGWALEFSPTVLRRCGHDISDWWTSPLLQPYARPDGRTITGRFHVAEADRDRWEMILVRMGGELTEQRPGWSQAATACLLLLLVEIGRALEEVGAEPTFHADAAVTSALATAQRRFREDVNVAQVALDVGMTPEHLTTLVRRATGRTLGQWLTDLRMAEARRLLVSSDLPVEAVGRRSGYPDPAHFSRRFKQVHGTAPAVWRRGQRAAAAR